MSFIHHLLPLGIEIGEKQLRIVQLSYNNKHLRVAYFREITWNNIYDTKNRKQCIEGVESIAQSRLQRWRLASKLVNLSFNEHHTYYTVFQLRLKQGDTISDVIEKEMQYYVPYSLSEVYFDSKVLRRSNENITVGVTAVPRRIIDYFVPILQSAGLIPVSIEPEFMAMARVVRFNVKARETNLVFYSNGVSYVLGVIQNSVVLFIHSRLIQDATPESMIVESMRYYKDHFSNNSPIKVIYMDQKVYQNNKTVFTNSVDGATIIAINSMYHIHSSSPQNSLELSRNYGISIGLALREYEPYHEF